MKYLLYYCFFLLIVFMFAYINSIPKQEAFTSKIRAYYRPIIRRTRLASENFKNKVTENFTNSLSLLSKKLGL
jgi:hypothetical protein